MCHARDGFESQRSKMAIRRALTHRNRPPRGPFDVGQTVYYWRKSKGKTRASSTQAYTKVGGWHGRAIVVATSKNIIWVNHAGRLIRCAPEHLRHAVAGEEIPWDKVEKCPKENIETLEGAEELRFEDLRDAVVPPGRNQDEDDLGSLLDDEYMDDWFSSRGDEDDAWDETLFPGDDDYGDLLGPARNDSGSDTRPAGFAIGRASEDVLHTTAGQALDQRRRRSGVEPTPWQPGQSQEVKSTSYHKNFDLDVDGYFDVGRTTT